MDKYLEYRDRLAPEDALSVRSVVSQLNWHSPKMTMLQLRSGPPLGALRAQSLLFPGQTTAFLDVEDAEIDSLQSPRPSMSSSASMATSIGSSATTYTYSTAASSPVSLVARPSPHSGQVQSRSKAFRGPAYQRLPPEIYDFILKQLGAIHEDPASQSCQTCHFRDLCSLALTSRAWDKAVVKQM